MAELLIEAEGLTVGYGGVSAVRDVDLRLHAGEVLTLLGANGAGKTTTLLGLVGILPHTAGLVRCLGIESRPGRSAALARAGVALIPDDRGIFPELTVDEHFRLASRRSSRQRRDLVLEYFPALRDLLGRRAALLSGGEQQMLGIAKSLMLSPRVLIIDEMSLGLAPIIVQQILPKIRDLAKEEGMGVLLVEQHAQLALAASDRAMVLGRGEVVLEDDAASLLADQSRLEAAYFGGEEQR
ncbi:ABC transporter ATP-binding protein [Microbacterium sp. RD1]|uniref:ABC transporter ATP-binding protein n=1 Tax=Microbacterium sp. RD1 TaxID=3457313 RepID=UPI003FA5BC0E